MLGCDGLNTVREQTGLANVPAREHQSREVLQELSLAQHDHSKTKVLGYLGGMVLWKWVYSGARTADVGDL